MALGFGINASKVFKITNAPASVARVTTRPSAKSADCRSFRLGTWSSVCCWRLEAEDGGPQCSGEPKTTGAHWGGSTFETAGAAIRRLGGCGCFADGQSLGGRRWFWLTLRRCWFGDLPGPLSVLVRCCLCLKLMSKTIGKLLRGLYPDPS